MLRLSFFPSDFDGITLETFGLLFFSTPHSGSMEADWSDFLTQILESTIGLRNHHAIVEQLRPFNPASVDSSEAFAKMTLIPPFACFVESDKTKVAGKRRTVCFSQSSRIEN